MLFVTGVQFLQFPSPLSNSGQILHIPQMPKSQSLSVKASKQRSHCTTSPLSTALVLLVTEVHWASLELSETQPQHSCQVVLLSAHVSHRQLRGCQETPEVCYWRRTRLHVVQSIIATTNIVNAMGNWRCTVTYFSVVNVSTCTLV